MQYRNLWRTAAAAALLAIVAIAAADEAKGEYGSYYGSVLASDCGCGQGGADCGCGASDCGCGQADCGCGQGDCGCGWGPWTHCTSVFGEFLYLHPSGVDMAHAQQQNGVGGVGTVPWGRVGSVDPNYNPGGRIGFNYAIDGCSSVALSYTYYESEAVDQVIPPTIPGGVDAVGSLVHHPQALITASVGPVDAWYAINFQQADLDFRSLLRASDNAWMNYSLGVRYGQLEQDFDQLGVFAGGSVGVLSTQTRIDFDGAGLKLGADGEMIVGRRGFSFYGKAAVSPMVGRFSSRYTMYNITTDELLADAYWKDDRFITMLEYEVGVAWTSCNECWRLSAGYMASFWYNAVTTPEFIGAVQTTNYVNLGDTISFDGITARVERRW